MSVDERCAAVGLNQLAGNPRSFWRANESDGIADIRGSTEAAHGRPAAFLPFAQSSLEGFGQAVEHAVFDPAGADGVHGDAAAC